MNWLTARELAGLPGMPVSERRTRDKLAALAVPAQPRTGRVGGGLEYDCAALPAETRKALALTKVAQAGSTALALVEPAPVKSFAPPEKPLPDHLLPVPSPRKPPSQADKSVADARVQLVNLVLDLLPLHGTKKSCNIVALQIATGDAGTELQAIARAANQRARGDLVSARTLERWLSQHRVGGWWGLLPVTVEVALVAEVGHLHRVLIKDAIHWMAGPQPVPEAPKPPPGITPPRRHNCMSGPAYAPDWSVARPGALDYAAKPSLHMGNRRAFRSDLV